jgi:hypothetical protein
MPAVPPRLQPDSVRRLAAVIAVVCGNCGGEPVKSDRFVPAPEVCRAAVEAVLVDWKEGRPAAPIDRLAVMVNVVDQHRKQGQALAKYEILGETPSVSGRCLVVRLKYAEPEGEETARYVVVGIDPLWVFRQEDLDLMNQWDHPMPPAPRGESETESEQIQIPNDERHPSDEIRNAAGDRELEGP